MNTHLPAPIKHAIARASASIAAFDLEAGAPESTTPPMALRTADEAREAFRRQGVSISAWAIANGFSTNLVFEVLAGRKKCVRGQAHNIAVKLGLKEGEICVDPARALERRAA